MTGIVIIGAGGVGSATAYHLAQDGHQVLLLEQFELGHDRGSSHGGSRIIRYTHDTTDYAQQMPSVFELWRKLEQDSDTKLMQLTGGLYIAPPGEPFLQNCRQTMLDLGFPFRQLTRAQLRSEFPQFHLPDDWEALYQRDSGILAATLCVQTMASQAVQHGAILREHTKVVAVKPEGTGVAVQLANSEGLETIHAGQAIITAGPWAAHFLKSLMGLSVPLRVTHQQVAYFAARQPELFQFDRFPIFIVTVDPHLYGFPIWERPGQMKIALEQNQNTADPDGARHVDQELLSKLIESVTHYLPAIIPEPVDVETCLYTETATRDFIIDRHPDHPQILFGAGFSGRGFKHVISTGRLLADLAQSDPGTYASPFWLENYRISRYAAP